MFLSYDKVKSASSLMIGAKQTKKAIKQGRTRQVLVAKDADEHVTRSLVQLCRHHGVPVVYVDSMRELGKACGIDVGAATAAILE